MEELNHQLNISLEVTEPRKFKVYILNDDYSSMEFVINVLVTIFHKSDDEAMSITMKVHHEGRGLCGIYPYDLAETKVAQVSKLAKESSFPLRAEIGEEI